MSEGSGDPARDRRSAPWVPQLILLTLFLVLTVVAVVTVLLPEIADDTNESRGAQETETDDANAAGDP